jgi:hypothetical protein
MYSACTSEDEGPEKEGEGGTNRSVGEAGHVVMRGRSRELVGTPLTS